MLEEVLTKDSIEAKYPAQDRNEAVRESGRLLVKVGAADPNYVDAMINNVDINGTCLIDSQNFGNWLVDENTNGLDLRMKQLF